jgi:tetratricopeptide (TPR) repeat protein
LAAKEGLFALQSSAGLDEKPWAKFRIETNLGSVAISLGKHDEAAVYFEKAYETRPTDCNAIANLALARTIQGRYPEAMDLARAALTATPRSAQAVSFLLQAAAQSDWQGDPQTLIPPDMVGTIHADIGLAEFLRKRDVRGWAERTRELAHNHMDAPEFRRVSARFDSGKIAVTKVSPEVVQGWLGDTDAALQWIQVNAVVCPVIASEKLPEVMRDHLRDNRGAIFDALVLAMQKNLLLVSDDLPIRDYGRLLGFLRSTWLHQLFMVATNRRKIDFDSYVKWTANLIDAGHNYLSVSSAVLARSAAIDAEAGQCPGYFFGQVSRMIGGAQAEPKSHIRVVVDCLRIMWAAPSMQPYRKQTTGTLLRQLIRERTTDYAPILRVIIGSLRGLPTLLEYMAVWLRGHFLQITTTSSS